MQILSDQKELQTFSYTVSVSKIRHPVKTADSVLCELSRLAGTLLPKQVAFVQKFKCPTQQTVNFHVMLHVM